MDIHLAITQTMRGAFRPHQLVRTGNLMQLIGRAEITHLVSTQ
jgi:hypothetical protein